MRLLGLAVLVGLVSGSPVRAQTLELVPVDGVSRILTEDDLSSLPQVEVTASEEGLAATYRGLDLRELATLAGAPTGRGVRGPAMALALLLEASDGYVVGLMLSEIDGQFGARKAIVARARNGAPLSDADGPLRVVVPDDAFHARWVRQLVRIRLVQLAASAPDPHR